MKAEIILTVLAAAILIAYPLYIVYTAVLVFLWPKIRNDIKAKRLGVNWIYGRKTGIFAVGFNDTKLSVTTVIKVSDLLSGEDSLTEAFDKGYEYLMKQKKPETEKSDPESTDDKE